MRIISFLHDGQPRHGILDGEVVRTFSGVVTLRDVTTKQPTGPTVPMNGLRLLPAIPNPGKIICIGLNYRDHAKEGGNPVPDYPAVFMRTTTSLVAHGQSILRPPVSDKLDFEAELAVVIGRSATRVTAGNALDHVAGYACFNDGSVRDYQRKSTQWTMGKNFDQTGGFGPELVTADELPDGARGLNVTSRVNGVVMQDGSTADMIFDVATLIEILSEVMTLEPRDVIATGTPAGVGYARTPPLFLKPGDICEVMIDKIGTLSNPIRDAVESVARIHSVASEREPM